MRKTIFVQLFIAVLLVGCSIITPEEEIPTEKITQTIEPTKTSIKSTATPTAIDAVPESNSLTIWLSEQLDPSINAQAGEILLRRLDAFNQEYPEISIDLRIKAGDGPGNLIDALSAANAAAPGAVPDIVALSYEDMQTAFFRGLLYPYDGLTNIMADEDWYSYAQELSQLQNSTYGLPFAGDLQLLVYRPSIITSPPRDWDDTLLTSSLYIFPAADIQAIFTLDQYKATGGEIQDEDGKPTLDQEKLTEVLTFYQRAEEVEVMPSWLTQILTDDQAWDTYLEERSDMVVTWSSRYLTEIITDTNVAQIITPAGQPFTLATGWVWSLTSPNPEKRELSARLAEILCESRFLAEWTEILGYLPPRPSSMSSWSNNYPKPQLIRISNSAQMLPSIELINSLGPTLEQATVDVLNNQKDPASAADAAIKRLEGP